MDDEREGGGACTGKWVGRGKGSKQKWVGEREGAGEQTEIECLASAY